MLVDRVNDLVRATHMHAISFNNISGVGHKILDVIDKKVGIITTKTFKGYASGVGSGAGYTWRPALLGERVRRLERHVFGNPAPKYFHLGAEADKVVDCSCKCHN